MPGPMLAEDRKILWRGVPGDVEAFFQGDC